MAFDLGQLLKDVPKLDTKREQIEYIRLDLIDEDPNNFYQLSGIDELAANIELCGLQQPIRVRPIPESDSYVIVSGHRRRKAVETLSKDDPERWAEVPCIIEQDAVSPALQQLRLIYANANTRTMTSAEISAQAEQVEKLLYQLKEEGYEFPGRMRDHVAQAVGQSKSKLSRLKMIRDNLAAAWKPSWEDGTLSESPAYELSKLPKAYQSLLFEEKSRTGANIKYLYADDVKKFGERASAIEKMTCGTFGGDCGHFEGKIRKAAVSERWGWFHCDNKCCKDCPELIRCKAACPRLQETVKKLRADAKEAARQEKAAQEEKDAPTVAKISALWQRFGLAREMSYKDIDACKKAMGIYSFPYDAEQTMKLECGEAKISPETKLPFGYSCHVSEISRLVALADMFSCSLDYLLCRTDVREMASQSTAVPDSGTDKAAETSQYPCGWYPASVEPPVGKPLVLLDYHDFADEGVYNGCGQYSGRIDDEEPVRAWSLKPSADDLAQVTTFVPNSGTGWKTGNPEGYGTYVAYVQFAGSPKKALRELLWTGDEWLLFGENISDDVTVCCWAERPAMEG